jgi:hypothetical protein
VENPSFLWKKFFASNSNTDDMGDGNSATANHNNLPHINIYKNKEQYENLCSNKTKNGYRRQNSSAREAEEEKNEFRRSCSGQ